MRSTRALARSSSLASRLVLGFGVGLGLAGCGGEPVATYVPITDPAQLYLTLALNHRAITLSTVAPHNTLQLTATPRDATGAPIAGLPAPTFHLANDGDSTQVWVTPEGVVQARGATGAEGVWVFAELAIAGNIRHADTARVVVTTGAPAAGFASLALDPVLLSDSAAWAIKGGITNVGDLGTFPSAVPIRRVPAARALDSLGDSIPGIAVEYVSLDSAIATVGRGAGANLADSRRLGILHPGQARIIARATVYGVTWADTLAYRITWPTAQLVDIVPGPDGAPTFAPVEVRLAPYGVVLWRNTVAGDAVDVTFEEPTNVVRPPITICDNWLERTTQIARNQYGQPPYEQHCGTGNVLVPGLPPLGTNGAAPTELNRLRWTIQARQFPVPGVYRYHSVRTGATGRIVVTTDPDPTALPVGP